MDLFQAKAVLFDLDGVLIDSEQQYTETWRRIDEAFPTGVPNFAIKIKGTTLHDILSTYFAPKDVQKVRQMLYAGESRMEYHYCEGAHKLLTRLKEKKIPVALVTSSDSVKMKKLFDTLPTIKPMLDVIIMADDVTHSKPHPEGYLKGAERLGVSPRDCVVVEDSVQGVKAGKAAGARVLGLSGTMGAEAVAEAGADQTIDSLAQIL